jgi:hypothetical protein
VSLGRCISQGHDLGVRAARLLGVTLTQNLPCWSRDDAANTRVRVRQGNGQSGLIQGLLQWGKVHQRGVSGE